MPSNTPIIGMRMQDRQDSNFTNPKCHQTTNHRLRGKFALNSGRLVANNGHFLSHAFLTKGVSLGKIKSCPIFLIHQE